LKISCSIFFLDENPESFRRAARNPPKRKESESGQSGSAGSDSGSDSSGSGDSDSDSDSDSSASETSRGVKKPVALQIRNLSARSNGELGACSYDPAYRDVSLTETNISVRSYGIFRPACRDEITM
jgi:hypothetical protein